MQRAGEEAGSEVEGGRWRGRGGGPYTHTHKLHLRYMKYIKARIMMRLAPPEKEMECRNSGWKPPFSAPMLESTTGGGLAAPVLHILGL